MTSFKTTPYESNNGTSLQADTKSNLKPVAGSIPKEKARIIGELQNVLDTVSEREMLADRNSMRTL